MTVFLLVVLIIIVGLAVSSGHPTGLSGDPDEPY